MRPTILFPLFGPLSGLPGLGPRLSSLLEKMTGPHVVDLLWHLPSGFIDRRYSPALSEAVPGKIISLPLKILSHTSGSSRRTPYRVHATDGTAQIDLVFFHARGDYLQRTLPTGETVFVSGKLELFNNKYQITHPDYICAPDEKDHVLKVEPTHPLTAGITQKTLNKALKGAIAIAPELPNWLEANFKQKRHFPDWKTALLEAHAPQNIEDLDPSSPARQRLAYDELLANQLALALFRKQNGSSKGIARFGTNKLKAPLAKILPFTLTDSQKNALREIHDDLAKEGRMLRLLQGDVGSGKTIVALMTLLTAIEEGGQGALMAPTEILALQHYEGLSDLCQKIGVTVETLTGRDKGKKREKKLEALASGETQLLIGTHALFQKDVLFHNLGIAIIDEQHRFGVQQRLDLAQKGQAVDMLFMTATPIPRTLTLTNYGDMECSRLTEKPAGRKPIDTRLVSLDRLEDVIQGLRRKVSAGAQIYWVCPLVEESEELDLNAATERYDLLKSIFGEDAVGLVHGQMKAKEKDAIMAQFVENKIKILVATTVIEVGVNVPNATIMIIEHAERFGLAQLHQLRGRVGRGAEASSCLLIYGHPLSKISQERLKIMRETEDGFLISEKDLELRGAGEILGKKQSGFPEFRLAQLPEHSDLLLAARDDANLILSQDPDLTSDRGKALKHLLYLFEKDAAFKFIKSG